VHFFLEACADTSTILFPRKRFTDFRHLTLLPLLRPSASQGSKAVTKTVPRKVSHFAGVCFPTAVDFTEAASTDYPMYTEVVHRQLKTTTKPHAPFADHIALSACYAHYTGNTCRESKTISVHDFPRLSCLSDTFGWMNRKSRATYDHLYSTSN